MRPRLPKPTPGRAGRNLSRLRLPRIALRRIPLRRLHPAVWLLRPALWLLAALRESVEVSTRPLALGGLMFFALSAALLFSLGGAKGYWAYRTLEDQRETLAAQVEALKKQRRALLWRIQALRDDDGYLEHLVRQRLGWIRPGEELLLLPAELPPAAEAAQQTPTPAAEPRSFP